MTPKNGPSLRMYENIRVPPPPPPPWGLDAPNDAGRFLPPQLSCLRDGSTCCSKTTVAIVAQGKSVSPVGIDMEISQLLLDVRSKTNNFKKNASYISGRN